MSECTRCGTKTTRTALTSEADGVEHSENSVIWLCDGCLEDFDEFLENPPVRLSMEQIQELKEE